jgi:CoA-transferase family III
LRDAFTEAFAVRDCDHWAKVFNDSDACVTPVLSFAEVETEPHITERNTFRNGDNLEPAPAPRFPAAGRQRQRRPGYPERTPKPSCASGNRDERRRRHRLIKRQLFADRFGWCEGRRKRGVSVDLSERRIPLRAS